MDVFGASSNTQSSASFGAGPAGRARKFNGSGTGSTLTHKIAATDNFTAICLVDFAALGTTQSFLDRDQFSGPGYRCFQFRKEATDVISVIRFDTSGNYYNNSTSKAVASANTPVFVAMRSSGKTARVWLEDSYADCSTANTPKSYDGTLYVGGGAGASSTPNANVLNGRIYVYGVFTSALANAEIADLRANPWSLFAPLPSRVFYSLAATAAPTLSAAGVTSITSTGATPQVTVTF